MSNKLVQYNKFLTAVKARIRQAQTKAVLSANAEMILMYWDIGRMIDERQDREGWGSSVIPRLSGDIRNEFPKVKGFSKRNIGYMIQFAREYGIPAFLQQPVAKMDLSEKALAPSVSLPNDVVLGNLQQLVVQIPWGHNILLMERVKEMSARLWYIQKTLENGWSRNILQIMISADVYGREGKVVSNFDAHLPAPQSGLAKQALKDPYIFDFLTLEEPFHERELEVSLIRHLESFLL